MRLLLFNLKTDAGDDVQGFTTEWINALAARFDHVSVISLSSGEIAVAPNVEVYSTGRERGRSRAGVVFELYRLLLHLLRRDRFDACFAHMNYRFALLAWPLLAWKRLPIVLWYAHRKVNPELRLASRLVQRVVTSVEGGFQIETAKRRVIGQGIDTGRFAPSCEARGSVGFRILALGRLSPVKRIELLIEALAAVARERPDLDFQAEIAGGPAGREGSEYLAHLMRMGQDPGIAGRIRFTGPVRHREAHLKFAGADCYVNLTATDSLEKAVLEAMCSGVPVITSVSGFREVLGPRLASEWMTPEGDAGAVAGRILKLAAMSVSEREELGRELRAIVVRDHSLDHLADAITREIVELAQKRSAAVCLPKAFSEEDP